MTEERRTNIQYGARVWDTRGNLVGSVTHIMQDTWTGKIKSFMVREEESRESIFFEAADVLEAADDKITVNRAPGN